MWLPFKELASVVTSAVLHKQSDFYYTLEAVLKKHKPDFISLLQNPVRKEWEGEMGREGRMRREREGELRREREGGEGGRRGKEGCADVQLHNTKHSPVSLEGSRKRLQDLSSSSLPPLHPAHTSPRQRMQLIVHKYRRQ